MSRAGARPPVPGDGVELALARRLGAPEPPVRDRARGRAHAEVEARRAVDRAAAHGLAAARVVAVLPLLALPVALPTLEAGRVPLAPHVLVVAAAAWVAGVGWVALLVRTARRPPAPTGVDPTALDLVALGVRVGLPVASAHAEAAAALRRAQPGSPGAAQLERTAAWLRLGRPGPAPDALPEAVLAAADAGRPVAPPLERHAADLRSADHHDRLARAERLGVRLVLPTALLLLPAALLVLTLPVLGAALDALRDVVG